MRLAGADTASQMPSMAAGFGQTPPPQHAGRAPSRSAVAAVATVHSEAPGSLGASGGSSGSNSSGRGASKLKLAKTCAVAAGPPPQFLTRGSACRHPGDRYTRASDSEDHSHSNQSAEREERDDEGSRVRSRDGSAAPPAAAPAAAAQAAPERKKRCLSPTFDDTEPQLSQSQLSQSQPSQPDPLEAEGEGAAAAGASEYQDERLSQNDWRSQFGNKSPPAGQSLQQDSMAGLLDDVAEPSEPQPWQGHPAQTRPRPAAPARQPTEKENDPPMFNSSRPAVPVRHGREEPGQRAADGARASSEGCSPSLRTQHSEDLLPDEGDGPPRESGFSFKKKKNARTPWSQ